MPTKPRLEVQSVARYLTERLGIRVAISLGEDTEGLYVDLHPNDLATTHGFLVRTVLGWRHVRADVELGSFAGDLLVDLGDSSPQQRSEFASLAKYVKSNGGKIRLAINGLASEADDPVTWPRDRWTSFALSVERTPVLIEHDDAAHLSNMVVMWGGAVMGMIVSLLQTETLTPEPEALGLPEGAKERIDVNRYERSQLNRAMCIAKFGAHCAVCAFDFAERYGELGANYIVVHHVIPVSRLGSGYVLNPATDLVPVCPNCHAMLHRRDPPLTVAELREVMAKRAQ